MGTKAAVTNGPVTNGSKYRSRRLSAKTPLLWRRSGWLTTSASRPAGPSSPASSKVWYPAANAAMRCRGRQPAPPRAKSITIAVSAPTLGAISAGQCATAGDAVDHQGQPLHPRLPASGLTGIEDDRANVVLGQSPLDLPHQLLAFVPVRLP